MTAARLSDPERLRRYDELAARLYKAVTAHDGLLEAQATAKNEAAFQVARHAVAVAEAEMLEFVCDQQRPRSSKDHST